MSATPITKSRPKLKLAEFRETAIEAKGSEVGVDLELDAGTYEVLDSDGDVINTVTVEAGDIVHVPHPLLLDEPHQDAFEKYQRNLDLDRESYVDPESGESKSRPVFPFTVDGEPAPGDTYRMAAAIIGEGELHRLLAGGGHSNDVALAWQWLSRDSRLDAPKAKKPRG